MRDLTDEANSHRADMVVFPELAAHGYALGGAHVHRKLFSTYLNWEERKHASPGQSMRAFDSAWARNTTLICNDAWQPALPWLAVQDGAELLLIPSNSSAVLGPSVLDTLEYWNDLLSTSPACSSAGSCSSIVSEPRRAWGSGAAAG